MGLMSMKDGTYINPAHVVQFTLLNSGEIRFLLSTGGEKVGDVWGADEIAQHFIPTIPASSCFVAVAAEKLSDGGFLYKERCVAAWEVRDDRLSPVFEGFSFEDYKFYHDVMIEPTGRAVDAEGDTFASLDEWKTTFEQEAAPLQAAA